MCKKIFHLVCIMKNINDFKMFKNGSRIKVITDKNMMCDILSLSRSTTNLIWNL